MLDQIACSSLYFHRIFHRKCSKALFNGVIGWVSQLTKSIKSLRDQNYMHMYVYNSRESEIPGGFFQFQLSTQHVIRVGTPKSKKSCTFSLLYVEIYTPTALELLVSVQSVVAHQGRQQYNILLHVSWLSVTAQSQMNAGRIDLHV